MVKDDSLITIVKSGIDIKKRVNYSILPLFFTQIIMPQTFRFYITMPFWEIWYNVYSVDSFDSIEWRGQKKNNNNLSRKVNHV